MCGTAMPYIYIQSNYHLQVFLKSHPLLVKWFSFGFDKDWYVGTELRQQQYRHI